MNITELFRGLRKKDIEKPVVYPYRDLLAQLGYPGFESFPIYIEQLEAIISQANQTSGDFRTKALLLADSLHRELHVFDVVNLIHHKVGGEGAFATPHEVVDYLRPPHYYSYSIETGFDHLPVGIGLNHEHVPSYRYSTPVTSSGANFHINIVVYKELYPDKLQASVGISGGKPRSGRAGGFVTMFPAGIGVDLSNWKRWAYGCTPEYSQGVEIKGNDFNNRFSKALSDVWQHRTWEEYIYQNY